MNIVFRVVSFLIGYAFGNISPGLILAKINGVDLRNVGSGNVGSTNVVRAMGLKIGLLNLFFDIMKGIVPAIIAYFIFKGNEGVPVRLLMIYATYGAVMGHMLPVVLKFKGGKGVATSVGFLLISDPMSLLVGLAFFFIAVIITKYVSLGSLICTIAVPVYFVISALAGFSGYTKPIAAEIAVLFIIDGIIVAFKHRENLKRLMAGKESKFSVGKKK